MAASVYSRTLQKAAELLGGYVKLCRHLHVPQSDLEKWIADKEVPPMGTFLKAVDLIVEESGAAGASEPGEPPAPRDAAPGENSSTNR